MHLDTQATPPKYEHNHPPAVVTYQILRLMLWHAECLIGLCPRRLAVAPTSLPACRTSNRALAEFLGNDYSETSPTQIARLSAFPKQSVSDPRLDKLRERLRKPGTSNTDVLHLVGRYLQSVGYGERQFMVDVSHRCRCLAQVERVHPRDDGPAWRP